MEALSRKKRNTRLDEIKLACQQYICVQLRETLGGLIDRTCQRSAVAAGQFRITVDEDDPDSQTLLVWYPTVTPLEGYVRQAVKIESGAKSALDPNCETTITSQTMLLPSISTSRHHDRRRRADVLG